jgi:hypothetical protein
LAALLLALAPAASAQEPPAETEPRVTAFQDVCIDARSSYEALQTAARTHGWTPADEAARPELPRVMRQARSLAMGGMQLRNAALMTRRLVGEEAGYLVLSEFEVNGEPVLACAFYAFDAPHAVPGQLIRDWVGHPADEWTQRQGEYLMQKWTSPPSMPGVAVFRHMYIRRDEAAKADGGVAGMILMLMAMPNRAQ